MLSVFAGGYRYYLPVQARSEKCHLSHLSLLSCVFFFKLRSTDSTIAPHHGTDTGFKLQARKRKKKKTRW